MGVIIYLITSVIALALVAIALLKNDITYKNHMIIANAIHEYGMIKIHLHQWNSIAVDFDDMEPYVATYTRWWDWGYTRILPPEKFEIIKPYIR